jgi:hypothetical protein
MTIEYSASQTISDFHRSEAFYRGLMGPVRGGKSTACCMELFLRACQQQPNRDGVRQTRFIIVRNTYRELSDTTIKTWTDWFDPDIFGEVNKQSMTQVIKQKLEDGTSIDAEFVFRALDRPDDVRKVLSSEYTGAWVNEAREVPKGIIDALGDRVGQFPPRREGGCTWRGVIMDTNPPDSDHWWYALAEGLDTKGNFVGCPEGWEFFRQPGGLIEIQGKFFVNPSAENLENLEPNYYLTRLAGKKADYIKVYYCGQYGYVQEGKPVVGEYVDSIHCSPDILPAVPGLPLFVGIDWGLTPAAAIAQRMPNGRWIVIDEMVTEDMGASRFSDLLKVHLLHKYPGFPTEIYGDPSGDYRAQTDEKTPFQIAKAHGINALPAPSNDSVLRREALAVPLSRIIDGKPGLILSPRCTILRKGLAGGYCLKRVRIAGDERYHDKAVKNRYSHIVEALEYLLLGAGEGNAVLGIVPTVLNEIVDDMDYGNNPNAWMGG